MEPLVRKAGHGGCYEVKTIHTLRGHGAWVNAVTVTSDGCYAVSGSSDETLKLWDLAKGQVIHTLQGHEAEVNAVAIAPDDSYVVSGAWDWMLRLWNLADGKTLASFCGDSVIHCCAVALDKRTIVAGDALGQLHFLRLENVK